MSNKLKSGLLIIACLCWYLPKLSLAQASPNGNLQRGVLVETVVKGLDGEKAGVQEGERK
jgi:hypothetical protein